MLLYIQYPSSYTANIMQLLNVVLILKLVWLFRSGIIRKNIFVTHNYYVYSTLLHCAAFASM